MKTLVIFERTDDCGLKSIEVYDRAGNFYKSFPYRNNKIGYKNRAWTIEKAIDYANKIKIDAEDKREPILIVRD